MFEAAWVVEDTDGTITCRNPEGEATSIHWVDLKSVWIETNDTGPWGADVWWLLSDGQQTLTYPGGATGEAEMLEKLQELDGFNNEELISAMGCTDNKSFVCWVSRSAA